MPHAPIQSVSLIVGMEVHVQLATRRKMFAGAPNPAHPEFDNAAANTLLDPTVLGLPGALPVMNKTAIEMSMMVGLALGCSIAERSTWDRKGYFYPDLPKGYQISQYDLPLCYDGAVDVPATDDKGFVNLEGAPRRVGIIRAHLEEDAGRLLHEAPGGGEIEFSIVDLNRAGAPLLEIVTQPDFRSSDEAVSFAKMLRNICRFLGVTEGIMQKGHMRFEPNINTVLTLEDGQVIKTPIVEIKNLNSFKSLRSAIEHELAEQPRRWEKDRRVLGKGMKVTRGWDDDRGVSYVQREKEDAPDYRYFPDPDLPPVTVSAAWRDRVKATIPELPLARMERYMDEYGLSVTEATVLTEDREPCVLYETCIDAMVKLGVDRVKAGRHAANLLLQNVAKRANERGVELHAAAPAAELLAQIGALRDGGRISANAADELVGKLSESPASGAAAAGAVETLAQRLGLLIVRDAGAVERWCDDAIAANAAAAADVRAGKVQAVGRLVGAVMKLSGGAADAAAAREMLLRKLGA